MTPASEPPFDEARFARARALLARPQRREWLGLALLVGLLVLTGASALDVVGLVATLLTLDVVRFTVMQATGVFDGRLLMLPLASGRLPFGASAAKEALVILSGPASLVVLSALTYLASHGTQNPFVGSLLLSSVVLAGFSLLPFKPYDGWRLLNLAIFSRSAKLEAAVSLLTSIALAVVGVLLQAWVVVVVAALNALGTQHVLAVGDAARRLEPAGLSPDVATHGLPEPQQRLLFETVRDAFPKVAAGDDRAQAAVTANLMREVHLRAAARPPSVGLSTLLVFVYLSLVGYFTVGLVVVLALRAATAG